MFEPIRGGTRGGQAEFKWTDVSADKDREHYLGHSINAPTGRWQKNKDIHWYNRDKNATQSEKDEEIRKIKEAEAEALSVALGFGPSGGNSQLVPSTSTGLQATQAVAIDEEEAKRQAEKEEKRRLKAERKEEKRARKETRRAARAERDNGRRSRDRSRSRSPRRRDPGDEDRYARRSRSPGDYRREKRSSRLKDYDEIEREKERERDRRKWDMNVSRHRPSA